MSSRVVSEVTRPSVRNDSLDVPRSAAADVLLATLPFAFVLIGYALAGSLNSAYGGEYVQGAANDLGFTLHVIEPVRFDRWLFGQLPTTWLQERMYSPGVTRWYDVVVALVYASHYVAGPAIAVVLWFRDRARFFRFIGCALWVALLGLVTYVVYPMAPPWVAGQEGVTEPVSRISAIGWQDLHLGAVGSVLEYGQSVSNQVAAMPSLHVGYAALCAAFFVSAATWRRGMVLACYPLLMGFAVVYAGEHYVIDVLVGAAYAVVVVAGSRVVHHVRDHRRRHPTAVPAGPGGRRRPRPRAAAAPRR